MEQNLSCLKTNTSHHLPDNNSKNPNQASSMFSSTSFTGTGEVLLFKENKCLPRSTLLLAELLMTVAVEEGPNKQSLVFCREKTSGKV